MSRQRNGAPGTTDQLPTWEGPPETRPSGYRPAEDDPTVARDAAGETLQDPDRKDVSDAFVTTGETEDRQERIRVRAHRIWEEGGRQHGGDSDHWYQAEREIDAEERTKSPTAQGRDAGPKQAAAPKDAKAAGRKRSATVKE